MQACQSIILPICCCPVVVQQLVTCTNVLQPQLQEGCWLRLVCISNSNQVRVPTMCLVDTVRYSTRLPGIYAVLPALPLRAHDTELHAAAAAATAAAAAAAQRLCCCLQSCLRILSRMLAPAGGKRHASVRQHNMWYIISSCSNRKATQGESEKMGHTGVILRMSHNRHIDIECLATDEHEMLVQLLAHRNENPHLTQHTNPYRSSSSLNVQPVSVFATQRVGPMAWCKFCSSC
jgi:hypothetical protein